MADIPVPDKCVIVVFGGHGDLAKRKLLPALYHLHFEGLMPSDWRIIGNSRSEFTDEQFDQFAREAITEFSRCGIRAPEWDVFADRLTYVSHEFQPGSTGPLKQAVNNARRELGEEAQVLFYLAVPPAAFPVITEAIGDCGLARGSRIIYEKPLGTNLKSFQELSEIVHGVFDETQVYRIDHFLGKEAVQNILALRFGNGMFEPVWNRFHIDHVQIEVPETLTIGTRASFYEMTGALRDMIVTHLFQVMSFVALEPPYTLEAEPLADEVHKLFESVQPLKPNDVLRGQYASYRREDGVDPNSDTDTFAAVRVSIDNWRWKGVPFYLRTGKNMKEGYQSVTLAFKRPPRTMFPEETREWFGYDHLTFRLGDDSGVNVTFRAKAPGPAVELTPAQMDFNYDSFTSELIGAYERLLLDAMLGDRTLFIRSDGIKRVWELVDDVLRDPPPLHPYEDGSWGPDAATEFIAPRKWHVTRHRGRKP